MSPADTGRRRFVSFEGIDGAGKSTQIAALVDFLRARGERVVVTREPGGTELAERVRGMLLASDMDPMTETLLFFAARASHVREVIAPALARGDWVVTDRFTDATYAYQVGAKGVAGADVEALERIAIGGLRPGRTFLFDLDPAEAARRRARARSADRFEAEDIAFFERVRGAYLARAHADPGRFLIVDAAGPEAGITRRILEEAAAWP